MNRVAPILLFCLLALALGVSLYHTPAQQPREVRAMPQVTLAPLADPETPELFTPRAGEVTVLNFFASWCVPCLAEHAELKALAEDGVVIEGVVWNDTPENVEKWLKKHGNPFQRVWIDRSGEAAITLGLRGVPESFVIDREGKIRLHIQGGIDATIRADLSALIADLNREGAANAP